MENKQLINYCENIEIPINYVIINCIFIYFEAEKFAYKLLSKIKNTNIRLLIIISSILLISLMTIFYDKIPDRHYHKLDLSSFLIILSLRFIISEYYKKPFNIWMFISSFIYFINIFYINLSIISSYLYNDV